MKIIAIKLLNHYNETIMMERRALMSTIIVDQHLVVERSIVEKMEFFDFPISAMHSSTVGTIKVR